MQIRLVHTNDVPLSRLEPLTAMLTPKHRERLASLGDSAAAELIMSELLVRNEASMALSIPFWKLNFGYSEYGKPYIEGFESYSFSVSHSGGYVAFIDSTEDIGIDIQLIQGKNKYAARFFTENEQLYAAQSDNAFFEVWTRKEAYIKMLGIGLSHGLRSFDVLDDSLGCCFTTKKLQHHIISVCSEQEAALTTKTTNAETLLNAAFAIT
ncbi:MAG: 4'-phosphopantetheinyl transferase superfamily protein [Ruminococcaceae bacterium]|nr:4'-phosphopantetheinyl transferase superfamily protein [Oscillospiraceae bacterium]